MLWAYLLFFGDMKGHWKMKIHFILWLWERKYKVTSAPGFMQQIQPVKSWLCFLCEDSINHVKCNQSAGTFNWLILLYTKCHSCWLSGHLHGEDVIWRIVWNSHPGLIRNEHSKARQRGKCLGIEKRKAAGWAIPVVETQALALHSCPKANCNPMSCIDRDWTSWDKIINPQNIQQKKVQRCSRADHTIYLSVHPS